MIDNDNSPDLATVTFIHQHLNCSDRETFTKYLDEARENLLFYNWCEGILEEYLGTYFEGIIGVFLFRIKPKLVGVDDWIWVVVGDLPPAYLTCDFSPNPADALESYLGAMLEWVEAAENGKSVAKIVPVNVPATHENAAALRARLRFLQKAILPKVRRQVNTAG